MCTIDFGPGEYRVYGTLEIFLEAGAEQAIRRLSLPLDFAVEGDGAIRAIGQAAGDVELSTAVVGTQLNMGIRGQSLSGYRRLWFELELSASKNGIMAVKAL